MKITIFGCGWLGLPLLESLVKAGHTVWGTSRSEQRLEAIKAAGGKGFRVDLPDNFFGAVFAGQDLFIITLPPGGRRLGPKTTEAYLARMKPFSSLLAGANAPHVIFTSTTGVYGGAAGAVNETSAVAPKTHSGIAVAAAEDWLGKQTDRLTVLRLAGLTGPDRHPGNFYAGRIVPNADAPVNLVTREAVIDAVHTLIGADLPPGIFNVCGAAHPAKGPFYAEQAQTIGKSVAGLTPGGENGKIIDSGKLRALGWDG